MEFDGDKDDRDVIDEMLKNHNKESSKSTTFKNRTRSRSPTVPDDGEGEVGKGGALAGKNRRLERRCRKYAKKFVENGYEGTELPVDLTEVEWYVSPKMTRTLGRACYNKGNKRKHRIKMSEKLINKADWNRVCKTIRHELVHIWQKQTNNNPGHGLSFKKWCSPLDIEVRADKPAAQEYKYEIHCPKHGVIGGKMKKCKSLRQIVNKGQRYCNQCGPESKGDLWVEKDGRKLNRIN